MTDDAVASAPRVSVVMPAFNAAPFLEQAVHSALGQTVRDVELLLVNDGSTDSSPAKMVALKQRFGDRLILLNTPRLGPYPARNAALVHARGSLVAFLDADDWWAPEFLERMIAALESTNVDVVYCGWQNVGAGVIGQRAKPYVPPDYLAGDPVEAFLAQCPWPIHAALMRRSVVDRLGGFSERRFSSMDYDFWIRMLAVTRKLVRIPEVLAFYRWHGDGQISATRCRQVLDAWRVRQDFLAGHPELVKHLSAARHSELVDGTLLNEGRALFWRRDLHGARSVLRAAFGTRAWSLKDLPLLVAAYIPMPILEKLVRHVDRRSVT